MEQGLRLQRENWQRYGGSGGGPNGEMPRMLEVYDFQGLRLSHIGCVKGLRVLARVLSIGQDHYPENLRRAVFVNLPRMAQVVYNSITKAVFDAQARAKFVLCDHAKLADVLQVKHEELPLLYNSVVEYDGSKNPQGGAKEVLGHAPLLNTLLAD
jgi:hypothetical protein